jgi:predicted enzyme related to lactoylglutathione lyase
MAVGVCWFKIPAKDLNRAKIFHEAVFGAKLREMNVDDDQMFIFESADEIGYIAGINDTEGNLISLYSKG